MVLAVLSKFSNSNSIMFQDVSYFWESDVTNVADWESTGRVITQTRGRAFQAPGRAFLTLYRAFSFLLNHQKLSRVF